MATIEALVAGWAAHAWPLSLLFTLAVALVAILRRACRRFFGARLALQLWSLVPLMLLTSELPHGTRVVVVAVSPALRDLVQFPAAQASPGAVATVNWQAGLALLWAVGAVLVVLRAAVAQRRFVRRLRGAVRLDTPVSDRLVWRAATADVGPALVGAWRPRIVVPADFDVRYAPDERALIVAHEAMHARRRDGLVSLVGQGLLSLFWWHPLAWWARYALRRDQELACDEAVLSEHDGVRRTYARALLKTQTIGGPLPVGCSWTPSHPLTERIAMLKSHPPGVLARRIGGGLLVALVMIAAGAAYAAGPTTRAAAAVAKADHFTLTLDIATRGHPASMHVDRCVRAGESFMLSGTDGPGFSWDGRFAVSPAAGGEVQISGSLHTRFEQDGGATRDMRGQPVVRTRPGQQATIVFGQKIEGDHPDLHTLADGTVRIDLTPQTGCSAASLASGGQAAEITRHAQARPAREVARMLARAGGYVLVNPEALDERAVTVDFQRLPATSALQLLADMDGMRAVFTGREVRFDRK